MSKTMRVRVYVPLRETVRNGLVIEQVRGGVIPDMIKDDKGDGLPYYSGTIELPKEQATLLLELSKEQDNDPLWQAVQVVIYSIYKANQSRLECLGLALEQVGKIIGTAATAK